MKEALKADRGAEAHLTSWEIEDFTKKGDNYSAMVTSVKLDFAADGENGSITYIAKVNPCHGREAFEYVTHNVFLKEAEFYLKLQPQLNAVLEETGDGAFSLAEVFLRQSREKE